MSIEESCIECGGEIYEDEAEGFCLVCGNSWIINADLFEERIAAETSEQVLMMNKNRRTI